ncbi:hypothetical protein BZA70DRAFT_282733 [Myxozyma melibiosi]|uniref:Uncharacterized protein n=1 Tax=Myxozyma melibiosi TaxID=54550 RepID=A0ABR1F135_9ASCO
MLLSAPLLLILPLLAPVLAGTLGCYFTCASAIIATRACDSDLSCLCDRDSSFLYYGMRYSYTLSFTGILFSASYFVLTYHSHSCLQCSSEYTESMPKYFYQDLISPLDNCKNAIPSNGKSHRDRISSAGNSRKATSLDKKVASTVAIATSSGSSLASLSLSASTLSLLLLLPLPPLIPLFHHLVLLLIRLTPNLLPSVLGVIAAHLLPLLLDYVYGPF